ncbi:MAG: PD40 domain-containing protein [Gemmataceae bacterium]|nr:PD40 domain-containing protein [Gemmataceae bacterium]
MKATATLALGGIAGALVLSVWAAAPPAVPRSDAEGLTNLALLPAARASASSTHAGGKMPIHQVRHLNDGKYGNSHSWISAGEPSWVEIDLGEVCRIARVVLGSEHQPYHRDRAATRFEILAASSKDAGRIAWKRLLSYEGEPVRTTTAFDLEPIAARYVRVAIHQGVGGEVRIDELEIYGHPARDFSKPLPRRTPTATLLRRKQTAALLEQSRQVLEKLASRKSDISAERSTLNRLAGRAGQTDSAEAADQLWDELRAFKRHLFLRTADVPLPSFLFVRRHIYNPSHIYTEYSDAPYRPGGGVCLGSPDGTVKELFAAGDGICRDPELSFDGKKILFSYRKGKDGTYHLWEMNLDGTGLRQLTEGPFHDMYPSYLPDGRIAFISTRCKSRVLCFTTEAATLFVMQADGSGIQPLTANNVNEYTPAVLPDGRILYTRWEYIDKGADHAQALWAIRPDGTQVSHVFGNNITKPYSFLSARPIPGTDRFVCTLASHWGDHVGPIGIVDPALGRNNPAAIRNLTPDVPIGVYKGYRDPYPLSQDWFLVSHAPGSRFGIYLLDAQGRRERLVEDEQFSCFQPIAVRPRLRPPALPATVDSKAKNATLLLLDVYRGLGEAVPRGAVKYLRIVEEQRHELPCRADGSYQTHFGPLKAHYASPTTEVAGPYGWPTYMAKHVHGLVPVETDGSAYFTVPADKPIYFQVLDANLNEIQRMRSFTHLRPGETQTCIGCHERRSETPARQPPAALRRAPSRIQPPPWGAGSFSFSKIVQPTLDQHCVSCHGSTRAAGKVDLSAATGKDGIPASYRTLIRQGLVRLVDNGWHAPNLVLQPLSFGTTQSKVIRLIDQGHHKVRLTPAERQRLTTWIDLNCPLWDNYDPARRN